MVHCLCAPTPCNFIPNEALSSFCSCSFSAFLCQHMVHGESLHIAKQCKVLLVGSIGALSRTAQGAVNKGAEEEESDEIFNFAVVENKPVFPGCEKFATEDEKFMCFNQQIMKHIGKNFEFPELARQMGIQGKVYVNFVIERNGRVSSITIARGVDKLIDDEAIRVIKKLPTFQPAKQRGKPVRMQYTVPINARLQ